MKGSALVFALAFLFVASHVECSYPLLQHIRARRQKGYNSVNFDAEELPNTEESYSPVYVGRQEGLKAADKITALPGQPKGVTFDQYGGYVTVDPTAGRALYYYFAEAQNRSSQKPLVLWLNGGPGCSSIGAGAMTELGPFRVNPDGKTLWHNPYAWNTEANVLFLESPAGVGFSYSNTSTDYITGDKRTALDSYTFLVNWLERFPEYKTSEFYMTGESYADHYVPQLAQLILKNNKITNQTVINLRGIAVGNSYIDNETQDKGTVDFQWTHDLISDEVYKGVVSNCNFSSSDPESDACSTFMQQTWENQGNIDAYNIYAPLCHNSSSPSENRQHEQGFGFDACSSNYVLNYLNDLEVQKAMHANTTGIPGHWADCNYDIGDAWKDQPFSVLPVIKELSETSGFRVWLYGGDVDSVCAVTTTRYAITKMGFSTARTPWYPWINEGEVGGYAVGYKGLTFVTIRDAGHFVPSYQPARALTVFRSFLAGKLPPSN